VENSRAEEGGNIEVGRACELRESRGRYLEPMSGRAAYNLKAAKTTDWTDSSFTSSMGERSTYNMSRRNKWRKRNQNLKGQSMKTGQT
jgi:hypothetical protein